MRFLATMLFGRKSQGFFPYSDPSPASVRGADHALRHVPDMDIGPTNSNGGTGTPVGTFRIFAPWAFNTVAQQVFASTNAGGTHVNPQSLPSLITPESVNQPFNTFGA